MLILNHCQNNILFVISFFINTLIKLFIFIYKYFIICNQCNINDNDDEDDDDGGDDDDDDDCGGGGSAGGYGDDDDDDDNL